MPKPNEKPADYIAPLNINGLRGRMLRMPSDKQNEILFIYGHHSSLERWWGVIKVLNRYGNVTMPDLPGFGGMDSFYKIGKTPSIDNMADYLASFIKLRYKRKKIRIIGLSFGFVVATRMLQKYPDLNKKVDLLVSVAGFSHYKDFTFSKIRHEFYLGISTLFSKRFASIFFKNVILNPGIIKLIYGRTHNAKHKFSGLHKNSYKAMMNFEVYLWHANDLRTHMHTTKEFLRLDNCKIKVDLPLHHITAKNDQYFDKYTTEQHLRIIYPEVTVHQATLDKHAPSLIADEQQASHLFPDTFIQLLKN